MKAPNHDLIAALLTKGLASHRAGDLITAARSYDEVLAVAPDNVDALNLKGVVLVDQGYPEQGISCFDRAIAILAQFPDLHFNKGNALSALGRVDEALRAYRQAISLKAGFAEARLNAAGLLEKAGRHEEAVAALRTTTQVCPDDYRGHLNLGICLERHRTGQLSDPEAAHEALSALQRAASLAPNDPDAQCALGVALARRGDHGAGAKFMKAAANLGTQWGAQRRAEVLSMLGRSYRKAGQNAEAIASLRAALTLQPHDRETRHNLAHALYAAGELMEAQRQYEELIAIHPEFGRAYINLGNIYRDQGEYDAAGAAFDRALAVEPNLAAGYANLGALCVEEGWFRTGFLLHDKAGALGGNDADARFKRALNLLLLGRLAEGWPEYEARYDASEENVVRRPEPPRYWRGEDYSNKRILIWTEQGLGDEILHAGMIPDIVQKAGRCVIQCSHRMAPVFARSFPTAEVTGLQHREAVPILSGHFDFQISVASLGRYLRPNFSSFPKHTGYLAAASSKAAELRRIYSARADGRKIVGLSWRSKNTRLGPTKSASLLNMRALLQTPGVMFVNLQYGDCGAELDEVRAQLGVEIFQDKSVDPVADMDAFFAQVAAMDLVVTTSNTTAHVAGSQNVPVWILLPYTKGVLWYWFLGREDSPWYPSARLVRATKFRSAEPWEIEATERAAVALMKA